MRFWRRNRTSPATRRVVYGVTIGASALTLLRGQLAWLRQRGWDVHLVTTDDEQASRAATREGVELHPLLMHRGISLGADLAAVRGWVRLLRRLKPAAVNVGTPKAALTGGLAAWLCRVPRRVYVVRGLRLEGTSGFLHVILWLMEWLTLRLATDVVVVSASLGTELQRRWLLAPKAAWLIGEGSSNGVHHELVSNRVAATDRVSLRTELGIAPQDFVIGYVGRLSADKGVEVLVDAVRRLGENSPVRLLLVGSDESGQSDEWLATLGSRGVHVGWTDDVWAYYAAMDALCLPTRREGFPNVVLEAGAAGLPTVTTRATGAVDSVVPGKTGELVAVDDCAGLSRAIEELANDPEQARQMGLAARQHVINHYDPECIWLGLESVLQGQPLPHVRRI